MTLKEQLKNASTALEYQNLVLNEILSGRYIANWFPVKIDKLTISVCPLLFIGTQDDPIVVMNSATLQQLIADQLCALLPTGKVLDETFKQADKKISAVTHGQWVSDLTMGLPYRLVEASDDLINNYGVFNPSQLYFGGWKSWILSKQLEYGLFKEGAGEEAVNHGFYLIGGPAGTPSEDGTLLYQRSGGAHSRYEIDYSQCCVLMSQTCLIDNIEYLTMDILKDPNLFNLLSLDGPLKVFRQPGQYSQSSFNNVLTQLPSLSLGDNNPFVAKWQRIIGISADGIFGPNTQNKTKEWQASHNLPITGIVDQNCWKLANNN